MLGSNQVKDLLFLYLQPAHVLNVMISVSKHMMYIVIKM